MDYANGRWLKYLSKKEVKKFFAVIENKRDYALFLIIYYYGLRVSEATLLTLNSINWDDRKIYIYRVKNGDSTERRLYDDVRKALKTYLRIRQEAGTALFTGREGCLKPNTISKLFKKYARLARLNPEYSVHCLRHSAAMRMLENKRPIEEIQKRLGHAQINNTAVYLKERVANGII